MGGVRAPVYLTVARVCRLKRTDELRGRVFRNPEEMPRRKHTHRKGVLTDELLS